MITEKQGLIELSRLKEEIINIMDIKQTDPLKYRMLDSTRYYMLAGRIEMLEWILNN
jgi:hypothetical protein